MGQAHKSAFFLNKEQSVQDRQVLQNVHLMTTKQEKTILHT